LLARAETSPPASRFLDQERLDAVDADAFQSRRPFPWLSAQGLLNDDAYALLRRNLPERERFSAVFGGRRRYGQQSHDRYVLEYRPDLQLPEPWRAFIDELEGPVYRRFLQRLTGRDRFLLHFHWHHTPRGCSVSPHCDATWKIGSHIFYLNTQDDWDPSWGGETLILDDEGRFRYDSAPAFEDFAGQHAGTSLGNASLLFLRTDHSWHGVRSLECPEGVLRKVFIVEIRTDSMVQRVRTRFGI